MTNELTKREVALVKELVECPSNKELSARIGLSKKTITNRLSMIFRKTGTQSRCEVIVWAFRSGLVT